MSIIDDVKPFRRLLEYLSGGLTDEQAVTVSNFFPLWDSGKAYITGDRVQLNALLYKCLQGHTSQADWEPEKAPSLWVRIDDPAEEYPLWRPPQGAQDAYPKGAKVSHKEKRWTSEADNNVWEPGQFGWKEVTDWAMKS